MQPTARLFRCSRVHNKPTFSQVSTCRTERHGTFVAQTILLKNLYLNPNNNAIPKPEGGFGMHDVRFPSVHSSVRSPSGTIRRKLVHRRSSSATFRVKFYRRQTGRWDSSLLSLQRILRRSLHRSGGKSKSTGESPCVVLPSARTNSQLARTRAVISRRSCCVAHPPKILSIIAGLNQQHSRLALLLQWKRLTRTNPCTSLFLSFAHLTSFSHVCRRACKKERQEEVDRCPRTPKQTKPVVFRVTSRCEPLRSVCRFLGLTRFPPLFECLPFIARASDF